MSEEVVQKQEKTSCDNFGIQAFQPHKLKITICTIFLTVLALILYIVALTAASKKEKVFVPVHWVLGESKEANVIKHNIPTLEFLSIEIEVFAGLTYYKSDMSAKVSVELDGEPIQTSSTISQVTKFEQCTFEYCQACAKVKNAATVLTVIAILARVVSIIF